MPPNKSRPDVSSKHLNEAVVALSKRLSQAEGHFGDVGATAEAVLPGVLDRLTVPDATLVRAFNRITTDPLMKCHVDTLVLALQRTLHVFRSAPAVWCWRARCFRAKVIRCQRVWRKYRNFIKPLRIAALLVLHSKCLIATGEVSPAAAPPWRHVDPAGVRVAAALYREAVCDFIRTSRQWRLRCNGRRRGFVAYSSVEIPQRGGHVFPSCDASRIYHHFSNALTCFASTSPFHSGKADDVSSSPFSTGASMDSTEVDPQLEPVVIGGECLDAADFATSTVPPPARCFQFNPTLQPAASALKKSQRNTLYSETEDRVLTPAAGGKMNGRDLSLSPERISAGFPGSKATAVTHQHHQSHHNDRLPVPQFPTASSHRLSDTSAAPVSVVELPSVSPCYSVEPLSLTQAYRAWLRLDRAVKHKLKGTKILSFAADPPPSFCFLPSNADIVGILRFMRRASLSFLATWKCARKAIPVRPGSSLEMKVEGVCGLVVSPAAGAGANHFAFVKMEHSPTRISVPSSSAAADRPGILAGASGCRTHVRPQPSVISDGFLGAAASPSSASAPAEGGLSPPDVANETDVFTSSRDSLLSSVKRSPRVVESVSSSQNQLSSCLDLKEAKLPGNLPPLNHPPLEPPRLESVSRRQSVLLNQFLGNMSLGHPPGAAPALPRRPSFLKGPMSLTRKNTAPPNIVIPSASQPILQTPSHRSLQRHASAGTLPH